MGHCLLIRPMRMRLPWSAGCGAAKVSSLSLLERSLTPPLYLT